MIWLKPDGSFLMAGYIYTGTWYIDRRGVEQHFHDKGVLRPNGWSPAWMLLDDFPATNPITGAPVMNPTTRELLIPWPPGPWSVPKPPEYA